MHCRIAIVLLSILLPAAAMPSLAAAEDIDPVAVIDAAFADLPPDGLVHPEIVKAQVLFERAGVSPGEIDGKYDAILFDEMIAGFAEMQGLPADIKWSPELWTKLSGASSGPVLTEYVITKEDAKGPFFPDLPDRMEAMQNFKSAGYRTLRELLAEKFHMSEQLLGALNPEKPLQAGEKIIVANVLAAAKPAQAARLDVDVRRQTVKAYSASDQLIGFFKASVGSEDKPSPSGSLTVVSIVSEPSWHYNPKYQFKEIETNKPFDINSGPNNPLGLTWIALSKPSYGIHGTSEPSKVGKEASHGCVRLTNWDAERLSEMLTKGVTVNFLDANRRDLDPAFAVL
jgi:lipoprotein-anchoring transpeptidase ErfK/SrfK